MPMIKVTIGSTGSAQQISLSPTRVVQLQMQNNGSHIMYVGDLSQGDPAITTTNSLQIQPGGADNAGGFASAGSTDLNAWYVIGTAGDILNCQWSRTP
jgi:hypothetical protein